MAQETFGNDISERTEFDSAIVRANATFDFGKCCPFVCGQVRAHETARRIGVTTASWSVRDEDNRRGGTASNREHERVDFESNFVPLVPQPLDAAVVKLVGSGLVSTGTRQQQQRHISDNAGVVVAETRHDDVVHVSILFICCAFKIRFRDLLSLPRPPAQKASLVSDLALIHVRLDLSLFPKRKEHSNHAEVTARRCRHRAGAQGYSSKLGCVRTLCMSYEVSLNFSMMCTFKLWFDGACRGGLRTQNAKRKSDRRFACDGDSGRRTATMAHRVVMPPQSAHHESARTSAD